MSKLHLGRALKGAGYALMTLISASLLLFASSIPAIAEPPDSEVAPRECLDNFDNNPNYVGEGWPGGFAASAEAANGTTYNLLCGDELSGVIHTAHPTSTGTVHPIAPDDDNLFLGCFTRVVENGVPSMAGLGRTRFDYKNSVSGTTGSVIVDDLRTFTYTVFTDGAPEGNNWAGCSLRAG